MLWKVWELEVTGLKLSVTGDPVWELLKEKTSSSLCSHVLSVLTLFLPLTFPVSWFNSLILQNMSLVIPRLPQKENRKQFSTGLARWINSGRTLTCAEGVGEGRRRHWADRGCWDSLSWDCCWRVLMSASEKHMCWATGQGPTLISIMFYFRSWHLEGLSQRHASADMVAGGCVRWKQVRWL